jgi:hypothetical protein
MTQKTRLIVYLKANRNINPITAWKELGIYRLSDVILRLRKDGHTITTTKVIVPNRFNEPCSFAKYELIE